MSPFCSQADDQTGETATEIVDVTPAPGTLVVFNSREMLHEVTGHPAPQPAALAQLVSRRCLRCLRGRCGRPRGRGTRSQLGWNGECLGRGHENRSCGCAPGGAANTTGTATTTLPHPQPPRDNHVPAVARSPAINVSRAVVSHTSSLLHVSGNPLCALGPLHPAHSHTPAPRPPPGGGGHETERSTVGRVRRI